MTLDNNPIGQLLWNAFRITYLSVNLNEFNGIEMSPRSVLVFVFLIFVFFLLNFIE